MPPFEQHEFNFTPGDSAPEVPVQETVEPSPSREEILAWTPEERNRKYKELVGQVPFIDMSPEQVTDGILNPEQERSEIIHRNWAEDKGETTSTYRRSV